MECVQALLPKSMILEKCEVHLKEENEHKVPENCRRPPGHLYRRYFCRRYAGFTFYTGERHSNDVDKSRHRRSSASRNTYVFPGISYASQGAFYEDPHRRSSLTRVSKNLVPDTLVAILVKLIYHIWSTVDQCWRRHNGTTFTLVRMIYSIIIFCEWKGETSTIIFLYFDL